jgi:hypothetical protein
MIIMVLGMMQFGLYLFGLNVVKNASRNGERACFYHPCDMNQLGLLAQHG